MKYLFILGKNIELSVAEVLAYLERTGNKAISKLENKNSLLVEVNREFDKNSINFLGGVISIGEVISSGNLKEIFSNIDSKELYFGKSNKLNYCVWDFSSNTEEFRDYLKQRFKSEKLKATEKKISNFITMQDKTLAENVSTKKSLDEEFFAFNSEKDKSFYFGKIVQKCDYESLEKRDMNKPIRRNELSISPRLAKIMINLSLIKQGQTLFDPFCGVGTILQEALLQDLKVVGSDSDTRAIDSARKNLQWFGFWKENYYLIHSDSRKVSIRAVNVAVCEPDLGKLLKKIPTKAEARKILNDFEELMIAVINNIKNKVSGRIVFTSPLILTSNERLSCDIERILEKTRMRLVDGFPIDDFRQNQIVGRRIFVVKY